MPSHDRYLVGWRAWYDDGSVYSSSRGRQLGPSPEWAALPNDGLIMLRLYYANGFSSVEQGDAFFEADGPDGPAGEKIYGAAYDETSFVTLKADIESRYTNPVIKRGRWTTYTRMDELDKLVSVSKRAP